jgi:hypothetical protein
MLNHTMFHYSRSKGRLSKCLTSFSYVCICSFIVGFLWLHLTTWDIDDFVDNLENQERIVTRTNQHKQDRSPQIFCFVLTANHRHLTSAKAIVHSWGKRCDRFYFVARLQNTSVDLMMLEMFENITDITWKTVNRYTLDVLLHLQQESLFSSYHWFLRATDDSFVIMPNLRKLISELQVKNDHQGLAYVGDVERLYETCSMTSSGSVMLFNRNALNLIAAMSSKTSEEVVEQEERNLCATSIEYDHEFVYCLKTLGIRINPIDDHFILSQNLSTYRVDPCLKVQLTSC